MFSHETAKKLREESGITQDQLMIELANEGVRISRPTISGIENGESVPDANTLAALSIIYKKPITFFFNKKQIKLV